jgi:molybdopterin synthase catalytic subunit
METTCLINGPITQDIITHLMEGLAKRTDTGGHSIFLGQVRADYVNNLKVKAIDYSAYEGMVRVEAEKIKETILSEFEDVKDIYIFHSTGVVRVGETSLFVLVSSGHRNHAIKACSKAVELIKEKLPVWKREIYDDDSHIWK